MAKITADDIKKVIETTKRLTKLGKGLSAITPTELDDKVIDVLEKVVSTVEPFVQDELAVDAINLLLDLVSGSADDKVRDAVKAVVAAAKA